MKKNCFRLFFSLFAALFLLGAAVSAAELTAVDIADKTALSVSGLFEGTDEIDLYLSSSPSRSASSEEKSLEEIMVEAFLNFDSAIDLRPYDFNVNNIAVLRQFFTYLLTEHVELFFLDHVYNYSYNVSTGQIVAFKPRYVCTKEEYPIQRQVLDEGIAKMVAAAADCTTDEQIALAIHDYLVLNFRYDTDYQNYDVYSFIRDGKGVCVCYARAYTKALSYYGIEAGSVDSDELNHEWNYIVLDGQTYHVDVTWDDPLYVCDSGYADFPTRVLHRYFLCSDEAIIEGGHTSWETGITASSAKYDDMWWKSVNTPMPVCLGRIFSSDGEGNVSVFTSLTQETPVRLFTVNSKWYVYDETAGDYIGYYYIKKFVTLGAYDGKLYFNFPAGVGVCDLSTGEFKEYASLDPSRGLCYGLFVGPNGRITAAQSFSPALDCCTLTNFDIVPVKESCKHLHLTMISGKAGHCFFCRDCAKEVGKFFEHEYDDGKDPDCNVCGYQRGSELRGDMNGDGVYDNADAIYLLRSVMIGGGYPLDRDGDVNGDGVCNNADAVYLLRSVMIGAADYPLAPEKG